MRRTKTLSFNTNRTIGIAAASTLIDPSLLSAGLPRFADWGYSVQVPDTVKKKFRYFAGSDRERAQVLLSFLRDRSVGAVWCARGGYGATRLLKILDEARAPVLLRKDPKLFLGFSDVTALHLYVYGCAGLPSVHCPMPATPSWQTMPRRMERVLRGILAGEMATGRDSHTASWRVRKLGRSRSASGVVLGGNLTLLVNLIGTPWQPNLNGKILFLEDCGEAPYRVDRMLTQLDNAGMLTGLRGVLLGDFESGVVYREPKEKKYWGEIFAERFQHLPVLGGLPVGHGKLNEPLPLGVRAEITASGKLLLCEQVV